LYNLRITGSADAILALVNAGARVDAEDKDGLTGNFSNLLLCTLKYACRR